MKRMVRGLFFLLLTAALLPISAYAKRFANEYCEFELPSGWECALEGSEWVCQSTTEERKREAIIILVAKIRGEQDSIEQYMEYLKGSKTYALPGGRTQVSEPKYAKFETINEHRWIDALHLASEVPGFYTRYLATTKEDLGIAVTFSVAKDQYQAYQAVFDAAIASLRVFRQKKVDLPKYVKREDEALFDSSSLPDAKDSFEIAAGKKKGASGAGGGTQDLMLIGIVVAVAAGAFFVMKRKKK